MLRRENPDAEEEQEVEEEDKVEEKEVRSQISRIVIFTWYQTPAIIYYKASVFNIQVPLLLVYRYV